MQTREIPKHDWQTFCDAFSRQHEGWLVTVEVLGAAGAQTETVDLPLAGIAADLKDGESAISVLIGETSGQHVNHTINDATHLWIEETESGAHEALKIEDRNGDVTLIRFRSTVLPEMVDGVVLEPHSSRQERVAPSRGRV